VTNIVEVRGIGKNCQIVIVTELFQHDNRQRVADICEKSSGLDKQVHCGEEKMKPQLTNVDEYSMH
jgi:hypothetical protein